MAIPTIEQVEESGANMDTITEEVKSSADTLVDQYGDTRQTMTGRENASNAAIDDFNNITVPAALDEFNNITVPAALDEFTVQGNAAIQGLGWDNKGEFSTLPTMTDVNDVAVFEGNFWTTTEPLPYTPTGSSPLTAPEAGKWVVAVTAELLGIARSFNILNSEIIYGSDTLTPIGDGDGVDYLYDALAQKTWLIPTSDIGTGETIVSVSGDELITTGGEYKLISIETINSPPFGIKVTRANKKKHYGWGSTAVLPDGRYMQIFRAGSTHATENNAQVIVHFSDDNMSTWYGEKEIYRQVTSDARPDALWVMDAGRIGFMLNRMSESGGIHYSPLFMYTDDGGITWNSVEVTMPSPYTFSAVGGIIEFPASQGGHDTQGFITFGSASAGQLDALTTVDNGDSWSIVHDVNDAPTVVDSISETCWTRIGREDKWLMYSRARVPSGWSDYSVVFATTNLLNWGEPVLSGVFNKGTPPAVVYNADTHTVDLFVVARKGKDLYDYDNALLVASDDADALWNRGGVYEGYPARVAELPNWFTGYVSPFKLNDSWGFTMLFGENPTSANGSTSAVGVMAKVPTSSKDSATLMRLFNNYQIASNIEVTAESNVTTEAVVTLNNSAKNISAKYGPYEDRHNTVTSEYLSYFSADRKNDIRGDYSKVIAGGYTCNVDGGKYTLVPNMGYHINANNIELGAAAGGVVDLLEYPAAIHLAVASTATGSISSYSLGTQSQRIHQRFINSNGQVGSISTNGSATSYTTSSDPRLKSEFRDFSYEQAKDVVNSLHDCSGVFSFKGDPSTEFYGFNAHKVLDIKGLGSEIGVEGAGSRLAELGSKFIDEDGAEAKVTPAGVDQSKVVPYLLRVVKELMDKVEVLENK